MADVCDREIKNNVWTVSEPKLWEAAIGGAGVRIDSSWAVREAGTVIKRHGLPNISVSVGVLKLDQGENSGL